MKSVLLQMKRESMVSAVACIVIGIMFIVWPGSSIVFLLRIVGALLLVLGAICLYRILKTNDALERNSYMAPAAACILVGVLLLAAPRFVAGVFPVIIGLFLLYHGAKGLFTAKHGNVSTTGGTIGSLIMLILGIFLIARPFSALKVLMVLVGIALVYDGIVMLRLTDSVKESDRQYREDHDQDIIDTDYTIED